MKSKLVWGVKILGLLVLAVHFALTITYVMPVTPIKLKHQEVLGFTIGTFFSQSWGLFAPNPISTNQELLVKCGSADWVNITKPLINALQGNRFTPLGRLERMHGLAIRLYRGNFPYGLEWGKACRKGNKLACKKYKDLHAPMKKKGEEKLVKIASSYCKASGSSEGTVAIRIRSDKAVKWSERHQTKEKEFLDIEVGVFPIDKIVIPASFYR